MKEKKTLTIGIPTYNRPEALCRRLSEIAQFGEVVDQIVICDNSNNTSENVKEALNSHPIPCNYIRNRNNVGGGANFIRVIENSTTDYMWWRGDDDVISREQVMAIASQLRFENKLILLGSHIKEKFEGKGVSEFVANFEKVSKMGWLSSIVLPVSIAKKALPWGYYGIAPGWANVTMVLGLFRVCPDLEFVVVPIVLKEGEFRDIGRDGLRWALFNTCLRQFPQTANVLANDELRERYIKNWRRSHKFKLLKTMVRMRLGFMGQEKVGISTIYPLLSIVNPRSTLLGAALLVMSRVPRWVYQILFPMYWFRLTDSQKKRLGLNFLMEKEKYFDIYLALRKSSTEQVKDTFL